MILRSLAHARAGDKGNIVTICLVPYSAADFALLEREITAERVTQHFSELVNHPVLRFVIPGLHAFNFVLHLSPTAGVTRSLALDAHGKCLGFALLGMEIKDTKLLPVERPLKGLTTETASPLKSAVIDDR